jgi:hypothetical protein
MAFRFVDEETPIATQEQPQQQAQEQPQRFRFVEEEPKKKFKDFNWYERHFTEEGQAATAAKNRNFLKSVLSGASAGFSEYFEPLKVDYEEDESSLGYMAGALLPIGLTSKGLGLGFNVLKNLYSFGPKATTALEIGHQAATGLTYGAEKQLAGVTQGKEFDPYAPVEEAAEFAAFGALLHGLVKYTPKVKEWMGSLRPGQAEEFLKGVLPDDLTPNQYKFWQDEVAPEWLKSSKNKYEIAVKNANQEADAKFQQDKLIAQANHEKDLFEARQKNELNQQKYEESVAEYENNLQKAMDEHEAKVAEIQAENEQMTKEFEEAQQSYQQMKTREAAVENATRLQRGQENLPYRPAPSNFENPSFENEVGNIISKNEAVNTTNAGKANVEAVRANDNMDYKIVNDAYNIAEELEADIETVHPNLAISLIQEIKDLKSRGVLSPPEKELLSGSEGILKKIAEIGPEGTIVKLNPVKNSVLHKEAKALRYYMDFTFEHGNARGILNPLVQEIQNSTELAARFVGNDAAVEAEKTARTLYREWADSYDNDYIRPYRDRGNHDYSGLYKRALNSTDEFNELNNILQRSNSGQQLANVTRRSAVESRLGKFFENPHTASGKEFEVALKELGAVISPQEANQIREVFNRARSLPEPVRKAPKPPKLKEVPEPKLPEFRGEAPRPKEPTSAKIAHREFVETPEVKIAAKEMGKSPTEIRKLGNSPEGIHQLKENVSPDVFKKIGQQRMREILYEGEISPGKTSGKRIAKILNTGDNFEILAEFLGEAEARETLEAAKALGDSPFTKDNLLKYGKKAAAIKALVLFGVL